RAEHALVRDERCHDPRFRAELAEQRELLVVFGGPAQIRLTRTRDEHRLPGADDGAHARRVARLVPAPCAELVDEWLQGGIGVRGRNAQKAAAVVQQVDGAEVSERRHRQASETWQRSLVVERRAEQRAHLGESCRASLRWASRRRHSEKSRPWYRP